MIKKYRIVRQSAQRIGQVVEDVLNEYREGIIEQEPDFTSQMLGGIKQMMKDYKVKDFIWTAKVLTDRSPTAQEKIYGADFMGVLNITAPQYTVQKGFLAQAKRIEPGVRMNKNDYKKMVDQCKEMLKRTLDSFLFLYTKEKVSVVPALSILGSYRNNKTINPHIHYSRDIVRFFEEHFESFIGDPKINAPDINVLKSIKEEWRARDLLFLGARYFG